MGKDNELEITKEERWEGVAKKQVLYIKSSPLPSQINHFWDLDG